MKNLSQFSSIFVANWKLNGNLAFINEYLKYLKINPSEKKCVIICPQNIHLNYISTYIDNFYIGAQNISKFEKGAFTGEISSNNLKEIGADFCIVGHSERREIFHETNEDVKLKATLLLKNNIIPIICIGETIAQKNDNKTIEILTKQIFEGLPSESTYSNTIIAYEPVWAIGKGLTPTMEEINSTHDKIRKINQKIKNFKILYGGSVNVSNFIEIVNLPNVDGALIGGSSLKVEEFNQIIAD